MFANPFLCSLGSPGIQLTSPSTSRRLIEALYEREYRVGDLPPAAIDNERLGISANSVMPLSKRNQS